MGDQSFQKWRNDNSSALRATVVQLSFSSLCDAGRPEGLDFQHMSLNVRGIQLVSCFLCKNSGMVLRLRKEKLSRAAFVTGEAFIARVRAAEGVESDLAFLVSSRRSGRHHRVDLHDCHLSAAACGGLIDHQ
jgi:hypothetical protein